MVRKVSTKLEQLEKLKKREPDKRYSDIVQTLKNTPDFMVAFNTYRDSISEGIDFLEELDITFEGKIDKLVQVTKVLSAKRDNITLLVGDAGEGKTTLAKKLMEVVNNRSLNLNLDYYFVVVKVNILKMKALGDDILLKEMETVLEHLKILEDKARETTGLENLRLIAFFDEAHKLVSAFGTQSKLGGDALKEGFTPAKVGAIACTTRQEYNETIAKDEPLKQRFEVVQMDRLSKKDVLKICKSYWNDLNNRPPYYLHDELEDSDLERLITWANIFFTEEAEPRRSTRLLKLLEAHCRTEEVPPNLEAIKQIFIYRGVDPDVKVSPVKVAKALDKLVGQEMVKDQIMDWAYMVKADAGERENLPIFTAFCYGPTGVGKTELVNLLSEAIFGTREGKILNISVPRYADKENGGELLLRDIGTGVDNMKSCIINVGEYEKGVPSERNKHIRTNVQPLFLDLLDNGICEYTDINGNGREQTYKQSLRNTIIVFTSNAGFETQETMEKLGDDFNFSTIERGKMKDYRNNLETKAKERLINRGISREFLGRQHAILTFTGLGELNGIKLAERRLDEYFKNFQNDYGIEIIRQSKQKVQPERVMGATQPFVASELAVFVGRTKADMKSSGSGGARQIKNIINKEIKSYIGRSMTEYEIKHEGRLPKKINVTVDNGGFDDGNTTRAEMEVKVECG